MTQTPTPGFGGGWKQGFGEGRNEFLQEVRRYRCSLSMC